MLKVGSRDRSVVIFEVRFGLLEDVLRQGVSTCDRCSHGTGRRKHSVKIQMFFSKKKNILKILFKN